MALHQGQRGGHYEVGPPVMRFAYQDRLDEEEADQAVAQERAREERAVSRQKVEPNRVLSVGGKQVGVYRGERALAMAGLRGVAG